MDGLFISRFEFLPVLPRNHGRNRRIAEAEMLSQVGRLTLANIMLRRIHAVFVSLKLGWAQCRWKLLRVHHGLRVKAAA